MLKQVEHATKTTVYITGSYTFFYKNNFIRTRGLFFAQSLRTIPASAEEQSLKF